MQRYFRASDVCIVTSLHDGMNLVAKEFIAARDDERGVLMLSQFTGAARELHEALIVNPYHIEQGADALYRGAAHAARRAARAHAQHARAGCAISTSIAGPGACCWMRRACASASGSCRASTRTAATACAGGKHDALPLTIPQAALDLLAAPDAALFLDFDGTLVDLAPLPDQVIVTDMLHAALPLLQARLDGRLALVSGRPDRRRSTPCWRR